MVAVVPPYIGAVIPTGWSVLWVVMPLILWRTRIEPSPVHWLGAVFLCYAAVSLAWSPNGLLGFMQLCALASVFAWAATLSNLRAIVIGLAIGLIVSDIVAMTQWMGIKSISIGGDFPAGLFVNSNVFAEVSAMVLVLLLIYRLWWWIPSTIPGIAIGSRAMILALLGTAIVWKVQIVWVFAKFGHFFVASSSS